MTVCLKTPRNFSLSQKHYENISCCCIVAVFLIGLPLSFHYVLGVDILIIHFPHLSLNSETIAALNLPENVSFPFLRICISYLLLILS